MALEYSMVKLAQEENLVDYVEKVTVMRKLDQVEELT
jgi:hypothetical protein